MSRSGSPEYLLAQENAERQRLVDLAYTQTPPPGEGMKRFMWFDDSDTPMPVDVPESVAEKIVTLSAQSKLSKGPIPTLDVADYIKLVKKYVSSSSPILMPSTRVYAP